MRRTNTPPVVNIPIAIIVTTCTRRKRRVAGIKLLALMFRMTTGTTNPRCNMRLDHRRLKRRRLMTPGTPLTHSAFQRMTRRARTIVRRNGDRGRHAQLRRRMRF